MNCAGEVPLLARKMAAPTDAELLEAARICLREILLHGRSNAIGGATKTRADEKNVRALIKELEASANLATRGPTLMDDGCGR